MRGLERRPLILLALLAGCGAKTGLAEPDAAVDAFVPEDAGVPPTCIEVPPDGGTVRAELVVPVELAVVDVFFLIDATASMVDEIDNVRSGLRTAVVPGVRAAIPDAAFGVALVGEFPVEPYGPASVRPYDLRSPVTDDIRTVESALSDIPSWGNFDDPEAQVEGLYQLGTGEGLGDFIEPSFGCPSGGSGGACFRRESLPVVVLITDAPFHNGPGGRRAYEGITPEPHTFEEAVEVLRALGVFVVGLAADDPGRPEPTDDLEAIARATGAVDGSGTPMVIDIGSRGDEVDASIVRAIERLAEGLPLDVDAVVEDAPGDPIDARTLVSAVRPLSAHPPSGVRRIGDRAFEGVVPGTRVVFEIEVDASALPPAESTRRVPAYIVFRAFGRSRIGREDVLIVLPGADGTGCDMMGGS